MKVRNVMALGGLIIASQIREVDIQKKYSKGNNISENIYDWVNGKRIVSVSPTERKESTDSEKLQKLDYTIGDNVKTLQEYKDAVSEDYECEGNKIANSMPSLWGSVIMLYGEHHLYQKQPSLRGDFGAILLEGNDPELCRMEKYKKNSKNVCVHIEEDSEIIKRDINLGLKSLLHKIMKLVDLIDLGAGKKIFSEATPLEKKLWDSNVWHLIDKLVKFKEKNFDKTYLSSTPKKKIALKSAEDAYNKQDKKNYELNLAALNSRDKLMVEKSAETIERLGPESAATIFVGNKHVPNMVTGLEEKFPQRPLVVCRPEVSANWAKPKVSTKNKAKRISV